jgi:Golgi phosphoprotein 3 GPP34
MGALAEDLLLVAIDPATGVLRCRGHVHYGLMGAELLVLAGQGLIEEADGRIMVLATGPAATGDPDTDVGLVKLIEAKRPPRVGNWVSRPRSKITDTYLDRLVAAGAIRREGGAFRRRFPVIDQARAAAVRTQLDTIAFAPDELDAAQAGSADLAGLAGLAGLGNAIGLTGVLYRGRDQRQVRKRLREICKSNWITEAVHRAVAAADSNSG